MATVTGWNPFGVALNITATGSTVTRKSATQYTVKINVSWKTQYSGARTNYGMSASSGGSSATINPFGTYASSGSGTFTGTYSISGNAAASKTVTVTFKNFNSDYNKSSTKNVSFTVSVPAWVSYTVTYNANGGSGAPSSQTKWKDQAITLSSSKPTRTGYSFLGWNTSSTATTAQYSAGGSYTSNASVTLYAVWKANTYTVKYNANGGTGAPANQTKTYGVTLTLSNTKPTRTNYNFKGWSTSSSATTAQYSAGGSYTSNASVTLYAVWELAYTKPRITSLSADRCNSDGAEFDDGTYARIKFDWACDKDVTSVVIKWKSSSDKTYNDTNVANVSASGTSGSVNQIVGSGAFDINCTYDICVIVYDAQGDSYKTTILASTKFIIDILNTGNGISFGKAAELDGVADFGYDAKFNKPVYGKALGMDRLPAVPNGSDFNDYLEPGCYAVQTNAAAATCANIPSDKAGRLEVWSSTGEGVRGEQWSYLRQRYIPYNMGDATWEREISRGEDDVWTYHKWWRSTLTPTVSDKVYCEQKTLWRSGGMYMTADHTATLSEAVSKQANGIVLVFSTYTEGSSDDSGFNSFFISKTSVALHPGRGHNFMLTGWGGPMYIGAKYLYINDTSITGNANNNQTVTVGGITFENSAFVLRYVIGV